MRWYNAVWLKYYSYWIKSDIPVPCERIVKGHYFSSRKCGILRTLVDMINSYQGKSGICCHRKWTFYLSKKWKNRYFSPLNSFSCKIKLQERDSMMCEWITINSSHMKLLITHVDSQRLENGFLQTLSEI